MKRLLTLIILILAFLVPLATCSEGAEIDAVELVHEPGLIVSFIVKDAFTKDIEEAIKSGVPTSFTFFVELDRVRGLWFDKGLESWEFKHTVKYDTLKQEYEVTLDEADGKVVSTKELYDMKRLMTTAERIVLVQSRPLQKDYEYRLRIMAELKAVRLPLFLDYVLFFVKLWDFETDWYNVSFTHL